MGANGIKNFFVNFFHLLIRKKIFQRPFKYLKQLRDFVIIADPNDAYQSFTLSSNLFSDFFYL